MASREEFTAFIDGISISNGASQDRGKSRTRHGQRGSPTPTKSRPPQPPRPMEQTPLLAPVAPPMPPPSSRGRGHGRSRSDMAAPPQSTERAPHPFNKGILAPPLNRSSSSSRPPRAGGPMGPPPPPPPQSALRDNPLNDVGSSSLYGSGRPPPRTGMAHRRAKSDIPLAFIGGGFSRRDITKADLLKSLPAPRWGGAAPTKNALTHTRQRSRTGSDGIFGDGDSVRSGGGVSLSGYGAIDTLSEHGHPLRDGLPPRRVLSATSMGSGMGKRVPSSRHIRTKSDASAMSVTTDLAKSALFKGVTSTGRIQLQLPKDSFRLLMDSSLEAGHVYKRKLVDDEGEFFLEFHTVDEDPNSTEDQKRLPPDLYVMAVDSSIYRRMLDEVVRSRTMPCGTFFCGHHEDVRHPDITIAALLVAVVIFLLLAGSVSFS